MTARASSVLDDFRKHSHYANEILKYADDDVCELSLSCADAFSTELKGRPACAIPPF